VVSLPDLAERAEFLLEASPELPDVPGVGVGVGVDSVLQCAWGCG